MSKILSKEMAKEIVTIDQVKAKKAFDKRAARAASPVKEKKVKAPKVEKVEEFSSETNEFTIELLTEEVPVNTNEFEAKVPVIVDDSNDDFGEFFGADQGFSLTSINEMIEEEEAKTFSKGLLKAYKAQILELYGQEVLDRMEKEEEFRDLILSHVKDQEDRPWSAKPEGEVKVTLQYWNVKEGAWYNTMFKFFGIEPKLAEGKTFKRYVDFDAIFNEDLSLKMAKTKAKNDNGETIIVDSATPVVVAAIKKVYEITGRIRMFNLDSEEKEGSVRIVLSHPRLGGVVGFDSDNEKNEEGFPVYKYGDLDHDGIVATLPSSFFEKDFASYDEADVLSDLMVDVSARMMASSAYYLSATEEKAELNRAVKLESKKAKSAAAIKEQKRLDFIESNKEKIDLLKKASSYAETFGFKEGVKLLEKEDAGELLQLIYTSKVKVNTQVYFAIKALAGINKDIRKQTVTKKVALDVAAIINDLNSPHAETRDGALAKVKACSTTAQYVLDAAYAGNRIFDKGVYHLVKGFAAKAA
jgi:hypothetical protein